MRRARGIKISNFEEAKLDFGGLSPLVKDFGVQQGGPRSWPLRRAPLKINGGFKGGGLCQTHWRGEEKGPSGENL